VPENVVYHPNDRLNLIGKIMIRHLGGSLLSDTPKWIWIWFHPMNTCIVSHYIPIKSLSGWWCNNHLEKYEFVNGKDYPIDEMENKSHD
jgi:hypothetical protein